MADSKADLVLYDGTVLGVPQSDSVAIEGGRVSAVGCFAELKALVGPGTHLIKLGGRTVSPGFVDSHLHFLEAAAVHSGVQLSRARNLGELLGELRRVGARTAPGNWLRAFGCDEALLKDRRGPTRQELDESVPKNPLRLRHQTLHASWLNSRAIAALGLERPGLNLPSGAHLVRDGAGRLSGLVTGMEEWLTQRLPPVTKADLEARARIFSRELASHGVTTFTDATVRNDRDQVELFASLISSKAVTQRVSLMLGEEHLSEAAEATRLALAAGIGLDSVKFMSHARQPLAAVVGKIGRAFQAGLGCAFHATEIQELETALNALETAVKLRAMPAPAPCRIEHGGVITAEQLARIASMGLWVVSNPGFLYYRGAKYINDPGLLAFLYRGRSLIEAEIPVAGGSDAPVTPPRPLTAIASAIARTGLEGEELAPEEALSPAQAWSLFTERGSTLCGREAGTIARGALADLVVLAHNPLMLTPAELLSLPVDLTIVGGQVIYERGRPAIAAGIPGV